MSTSPANAWRNFGQRAAGRITGAALCGLRRETRECSRHDAACGGFDRGLNFASLMTDDHYQRVGLKARDRAHHARDHRLPSDLVQHLGSLGAHPGAQTGGENYRGERSWHQRGLSKNGREERGVFGKLSLISNVRTWRTR